MKKKKNSDHYSSLSIPMLFEVINVVHDLFIVFHPSQRLGRPKASMGL